MIDQYIVTTSSSALRRRLMCEKELNLQKLIEIASTHEISSAQVSVIEKQEHSEETVNKIGFTTNKKNNSNFKTKIQKPKQNTNKNMCYGCGKYDHFHGNPECPAKGKKCNYCSLPNHLEYMCQIKLRNESSEGDRKPFYQNQKKKNINNMLEAEESSDEEYLFSMNNKSDIVIKIDNQSVPFLRHWSNYKFN